MKLSGWLLSGLALSTKATKISDATSRDYDAYDYYAAKLDSSASPEDIASHLDIEYDGRLRILDDTHIFRTSKDDSHNVFRHHIDALDLYRIEKRDSSPHILDSVKYNQKQIPSRRLFKRSPLPHPAAKRVDTALDAAIAERSSLAKDLGIEDPIFNQQWHLFNTWKPGNDINVTGVWRQGITGKGATACIVDDGLDMDSLDLKDNYFPEGSYDYNDKGPEPRPRLDDDNHGTRCAGEVAAGKNSACGLGIAYDARVSGVRILSAPIADVDEAEAVIHGFQVNDIYSCSWGPPDDGRTMDAPGLLIKKAIQKAILEGRGGKGTVYVFAAGNGAAADDNCNFDGYTNSIFSVTIGAIDRSNRHPYYSERCSAQLAVTYSSGDGESIHTTDVGYDRCTSSHGGTSAAGPIVTGVYALVIGLRPDLTWRDMQWLTVLSVVPFYDQEPIEQWQTTATGKKYSHQYGYGKIDAYAIVELAKDWINVKKQAWYFSPWIEVNHTIPEGDQGLRSQFEITQEMLTKANLERVEHVTVTMNIEHSRRGDLSVDLISPFGVVSHLSETRKFDEAPVGYVDWTFMTVAHFGESGVGTWTIVVRDTVDNSRTGEFLDWQIKLYGESIDGNKQGLLPYPDEEEDTGRIVPGTVQTTSLNPQPTSSITVTSGLPTRPSISKPTDAANDDSTGNGDKAAEQPSQSASASEVPSSQTAQPVSTPTGIPSIPNQHDPPINAAPGNDDNSNKQEDNNFLPQPFPTFGLSKKTQVWIYGALALILLFCASLAGYLWMQRRKRWLKENPRDNYGFMMLDDLDEADGMLGGGKNSSVEGKGRVGRRRRAGELYDAFAGESDEDGELFSDEDGEEDEEGGGHNRRNGERRALYRDVDDEGTDEEADEKR